MGAVNRLVEIALMQPGSRHLWVDTVHRNNRKYRNRYFKPLLAGVPTYWDSAQQSLTFPGASFCDFGSAVNPKALEGLAYDYIWVNEAGLVLKNEDLYHHTLLPMVLESKRAQMFFVGTPKGKGLFHRMFQWGQDPNNPNWQSFRHPSHKNFTLNPKELKEMKKHMPDQVYRQEVLAEFMEGDNAVFRDVEQVVLDKPPEAPIPGAAYIMGVDLARHQDYTVIWVGRFDTLTAIRCERFTRISWGRQVERIAALSRLYGDAPVIADATGPGDPVCEALEEHGLSVTKVVFTQARKRQLIDRLAMGLEQQHLKMVRHDQTLAELAAFEYQPLASGSIRTGARPGEHDDCVIALALCWQGMAGWGNEFILGNKLMVTGEIDY